MANRWSIPTEVEKKVRVRDTSCVYCGMEFSGGNISRKNKPSWEHIINDIRINGIDNIAICCISCNSSKGVKLIDDWLKSDYCKTKGISFETVAQVVKNRISSQTKVKD